jgi:hypothetical protein
MSIIALVAAAIIASETIVVDSQPPVREESKYPRTLQEVDSLDLSFMEDSWVADMMRDVMMAVILSQENCEIIKNKIDPWTHLSIYEPPEDQGFMFSRGDLVVESVQRHMKVGHSGGSMAMTMRELQLLAKIGFPEYRNMYVNKSK